MQGMTEISLGILLVIGLLTDRPHLWLSVSRQPLDSEWGTSWIWELLVPVLASLALASDAPPGNGALTRGCRNGGHLLRGGDRPHASVRYHPTIMKRSD